MMNDSGDSDDDNEDEDDGDDYVDHDSDYNPKICAANLNPPDIIIIILMKIEAQSEVYLCLPIGILCDRQSEAGWLYHNTHRHQRTVIEIYICIHISIYQYKISHLYQYFPISKFEFILVFTCIKVCIYIIICLY